ncbi:hypothetical protein PF011_g4490 [Phytophthora fragariae]|uniref:Uncharacterized protein n=1 Tax=Phytophthora fragariae TaxID=53985 RepID=A0A6A3LT38_9STRA|nr:hypothetical protein PF011_g4490 [Phytophthora fragariae]
MALYDLMEFSLCGTVGVVALVAALNALNYLLKWTSFGLETTVVIGCMGLLTHGWRLGDGDDHLRKMAPHFGVGSAWDTVLQQADDRDRSESASLLRLQEPDMEELEDFQAALDDPYSGEWTPQFGEASVDPVLPKLLRSPRWPPRPSSVFAEDGKRLVGEIVPYPGMWVAFQVGLRWTWPVASHPRDRLG